jgi:hypothetical protein
MAIARIVIRTVLEWSCGVQENPAPHIVLQGPAIVVESAMDELPVLSGLHAASPRVVEFGEHPEGYAEFKAGTLARDSGRETSTGNASKHSAQRDRRSRHGIEIGEIVFDVVTLPSQNLPFLIFA